MRLRVGDETSQISAAPFHISFPMPMAKCCGCFFEDPEKNDLKQVIRYNPGWMGSYFAFTWNNSSHFAGGFPSPNTDLLKIPYLFLSHSEIVWSFTAAKGVHQNRKLQTSSLLIQTRREKVYEPIICFSGFFCWKMTQTQSLEIQTKHLPLWLSCTRMKDVKSRTFVQNLKCQFWHSWKPSKCIGIDSWINWFSSLGDGSSFWRAGIIWRN